MRQRHIGLGFPAEIDRPVVDLVRHGFGEFRVVRIVGAAADHVHGEPRNAQALLAGGIELRQLGDGRDLAQQPQGIEPALLDRAGRPRQLRRPPKLAFDFPDELADLGGRSLGLFALNAHQRSLVFLIVEPYVENAVGQQRKRDHRREQHDIFAEQAVADFGGRDRSRTGRGSGVLRAPVRLRRQIVHSITSSASASTVGGTVRPSACALFRFTNSSNFVGCWTGSSAGLAPLRMRSM